MAMLEALADEQPGAARSGHGDRIERIVRAGVSDGWKVHGGPVWLMVAPPGPDQSVPHGWKLHLSSRASTLPALVERVLPALIAEGCPFKVARSAAVLEELNDGVTAPAAVGKAITVYPAQDRVRELGIALAEVLAGHEGPRVLSDRRVSGSAPVYYRYGPFAATPEANARGELLDWLHGPCGQRFEAAATLSYSQPPWAADPFTGQGGQPERAGSAPPVVGGRYQIIAGVRESARGNVFRALDLRDGATVIVKQARALVSEDADDADARLRVRNERRIYQVLADVPGVPRFIDHFRHQDDEFLVTSDCGTATLVEDVVRRGPYRCFGGDRGVVPPGQCFGGDRGVAPPGQLRPGQRDLGQLARQLARIVLAVHERGVIARDLAPSNIVLDGDRVSLVDFGLGCYDGVVLIGGTPGYAPARQMRHESPSDTDDLYALGMTLLFAATRLHPVIFGEASELPLARALQAISAAHGPRPTGIMAAVVGLLAGGDRARQAARALAAHDVAPLAAVGPLPAPPAVTIDLADEIKESLLADLLREVDKILDPADDSGAAYDGCMYTGSAGIGLELLFHADRPGVADRLAALGSFTARAACLVGLPHGLYTGRTGADIFLERLRGSGIDVGAIGSPALPATDFRPEGDDLIVGGAGVGIGHLQLYRLTGDQRHLEVARRCAASVVAAEAPASSFGRNPDPEYGVEPAAGRAHGLAGVTEFLLCYAGQTADPAVRDAAAARVSILAAQTPDLVRTAGDDSASPLAASWCQGLAGIGLTLARAGLVLGDPGLLALARESADACIALLPRIGALGQCCGAAGLGGFMIELAALTSDPGYLESARQVAAHMLLRGGGTPGHPVFTERAPDNLGISWGAGLPGMLTFFRRLSRQGGPDIMPACPRG